MQKREQRESTSKAVLQVPGSNHSSCTTPTLCSFRRLGLGNIAWHIFHACDFLRYPSYLIAVSRVVTGHYRLQTLLLC